MDIYVDELEKVTSLTEKTVPLEKLIQPFELLAKEGTTKIMRRKVKQDVLSDGRLAEAGYAPPLLAVNGLDSHTRTHDTHHEADAVEVGSWHGFDETDDRVSPSVKKQNRKFRKTNQNRIVKPRKGKSKLTGPPKRRKGRISRRK